MNTQPDIDVFLDGDNYGGISVAKDGATISNRLVKDRDHYPMTPDEMVDLARSLLNFADTLRKREAAQAKVASR